MAFASEVGIDLGTANVLVYIKGKGIVLNEPSVVAINNDTDEILAVGEEARQMLGRTPANIVAIRPLRDGVVSDYDITERMLKYFIRKTCGSGRFFKPRIMVCVPSGVTEVEKRAVREAAEQAGGKDVFLMEEPVAAAIGAGIDISKPDGVMVIDIGGGTTDIAVISLGGIVASSSVKMAGDKFDEAIVKYMRKAHKLYIGERTAEELKMTIGTAFPREEVISRECRGRDLVTGLPKSVEVTSEEIMDALGDDGMDPERFVADRCRLMLDYVRREGMPEMPGAREALEALRRRGVKTALVTSNGREVVREYLEISGFGPYFDQVVTGEMVPRSKPDPDIYLLGAKLLSLSPAECAGVEDSVNGVKAIRAAGMLCVMVPDIVPYGPELAPYVDVCLGSLRELEQALFEKE